MRIIALPIVSLMLALSSASGEPYVSLNGGFQIEVPSDWIRVDYRTVDYFLSRAGAGQTVLNYDAVFAPSTSKPFFTNQYLILTVDTSGEFSEKSIDSAIYQFSRSFGQDIKYFPVGDFMSDIKTNSPVYDKDKKLVSILSDIVENDQPLKKHLLMMKFYERGIAYFYCYAPDSLFESSKSTFLTIVESFDKPQKVGTPTEELKIADLSKPGATENHEDDTSDGGDVKQYAPWLAVPVVILIIALARRKRKMRDQQTKE